MYHERMGALTPDDILQELQGLLEGERDPVATLANAAALLYLHLEGINWLGFYIVRQGELVLGPFQGKPACTRIAMGRGVCGAACQRGETMLVGDVTIFPGHIACDPQSRSELVVPLRCRGQVVGVLDCDAPETGRFGEPEQRLLEGAALIVGRQLDAAGGSL